MERIKEFLRNFMTGRYGIDQFSQTMFIAALVLIVLAMFTGSGILELLGLGVFIYAYFRILSKNITARRAENEKYLDVVSNLKGRFSQKASSADKQHRVFTCPNKECRQKIRVPRGKGKIRITCPKCKTQFIKRT